MRTRIKLSDLRGLIAEEMRKVLSEAEKVEEEDGEDSLDSQIDNYFADYEAEGKNAKNEGLDFRRFMRRFLNEAEEEEEKSEEEEPKEDEAESGEEEAKEPEEPKKLTSEDLDVDSFVDSVVRLVDNYDSLLEVRNTILRRAVNFLLKSYQPDVADAFKESLMDRHGLEVGKSKYEHEADEFQAPPADRAGVSPGGA